MDVEFAWASGMAESAHTYLRPKIDEIITRRFHGRKDISILDVGAGNGSMTAVFAQAGYDIIGVEPSASGLKYAKEAYPGLRLEAGSGYEDLAARFGTFDVVVSCEVIEHLLTPGIYLRRIRDTLKPSGIAIISTPYHAYLKNVLIALAGKWDLHHHPTREWGHVKFFSRKTIDELASVADLRELEFHRVGRVPIIAKSMISVFGRA